MFLAGICLDATISMLSLPGRDESGYIYLWGEMEYVSFWGRGYPFEYALAWCRELIFVEDEDTCNGNI
jgi:hypothetical protein